MRASESSFQSTHSLRLVPILLQSGTSTSGSESEEDPGDYSLGTFQFVMKTADTCHVKTSATIPNGTKTVSKGIKLLLVICICACINSAIVNNNEHCIIID